MPPDPVFLHMWPQDDECFWGNWQTLKGMPNATQYRACIHPNCKKTEVRDAPKA